MKPEKHEIASLTYAGKDIPISSGLLSLIRDTETWSLRVLTDDEWSPQSMAHEAEIRVTTQDKKVIVLTGRCSQGTGTRLHLQGQGPVGMMDVSEDE